MGAGSRTHMEATEGGGYFVSTKTTNYSLIKPAENDYVSIGDINSNMDTIDTKLKAVSDVANSASSAAGTASSTASAWNKTITVSVGTSWSGSGPYTQTVTVSGLKTTDVFAVECGVLSDTTADNAKSWRKMFSCVTAAKCDADGALILTCHNKKPTASFNIRVRGVSG